MFTILFYLLRIRIKIFYNRNRKLLYAQYFCSYFAISTFQSFEILSQHRNFIYNFFFLLICGKESKNLFKAGLLTLKKNSHIASISHLILYSSNFVRPLLLHYVSPVCIKNILGTFEPTKCGRRYVCISAAAPPFPGLRTIQGQRWNWPGFHWFLFLANPFFLPPQQTITRRSKRV